MVVPPARASLTKDDWARAALQVIADSGVDAVSVERLASTLRVTKGSFYWHFHDRAALVAAALDLWETEATDAVIAELQLEPDPATRLQLLFEISFADEVGGPVDAALSARVGDDAVGSRVRRVTERRIAFLEGVYRDLGHPGRSAARRARLTYCAYLGHFQVRRALQDDRLLAPSPAYLRELMAVLTA